ncbi:MAG: DUF2157 domain-containing protein [Candidatus Absconditabacterales bacterium]|nr:DUF2157 domain-containing protein [Candidatus Absconditabacterales bacterium]
MNTVFFHWFYKRIEEIKQKGIITQQQSDSIADYYNNKNEYGIFSFSSIISLFGAILIGASVILFISSNWNEFGKWTRFLILNSFLIFSYIIGFVLYNYTNRKKTGTSIVFLGNIVFGASIFLVAQIFNIQSKYSNGILAWRMAKR